MTEPFPCDCGLDDAEQKIASKLAEAERLARIKSFKEIEFYFSETNVGEIIAEYVKDRLEALETQAKEE